MKERSSNSPASFKTLLLSVLATLIICGAAFGQEPQPAPPQKAQEPVQQSDDRVKINTALVTVPVVVTDGYGNFVTGLRQGDFMVREDGTLQKIDNFSSTEAPFNVALLIDTSRSTKNKLGVIRKAALTFVKQLQPNDRVMIVTFDEKVRFVSDFTSDHRALEGAIRSVGTSYLTSLYDAIYRTVTEKLIPLQGGRKAIVVLTDGVDTASKQATFEGVLDLVATNGIISYAIQYETRNDGSTIMRPMYLPGQNFLPGSAGRSSRSIDPDSSVLPQQPQERQPETQKDKPIVNIPRPSGSGVTLPSAPQEEKPAAEKPRSSSQVIYLNQKPKRDPYLIATDFLGLLARQSGARHLRAESIENTSFAFALIANELRHQYTLTYYSSNDARDGGYRTISVNLANANRNLIVRTRQGYRAPKGDAQ
jgi:VWFA-related protein